MNHGVKATLVRLLRGGLHPRRAAARLRRVLASSGSGGQRLGRLPGHRWLILAPHPDDESIGCGGVLAHSREGGVTSRVVFLTDGAGGDPEVRQLPPGHPRRAELIATRKREAVAALAVLGVGSHAFLDAPDGALSPHDERLVAGLAGEIAAFRPDLVLLPFPADAHRDHAATAPCLLAALARAPGIVEPQWAGYEIWSPLPANLVVDLGAAVARKRAAIECHRSQLRTTPYVDGALGLNRYRAVTAGLGDAWAEAFHLATIAELRALVAALAA